MLNNIKLIYHLMATNRLLLMQLRSEKGRKEREARIKNSCFLYLVSKGLYQDWSLYEKSRNQ